MSFSTSSIALLVILTCLASFADASFDFICLAASDYLPSHSVDAGMTCDQYIQQMGFMDTTKCTDGRPSGQGDTTWKQKTNQVAVTYGCCGTEKKSACWEDLSAGVCKTAADYLPNHSFDAGGGNMMTCDAWSQYAGFTNTPQCTDGQSGQGDTTWKQMTIHTAVTFGCCGTEKKSACWEDLSAGVCKTAADYLPNHSFDAGGGNMMTCDAYSQYAGFTNTPQCTDGQSGQGDTTWKQMTNRAAVTYGCCGAGKKSACWEDVSAGVCQTATSFLPNKMVSMGGDAFGNQTFTCDAMAAMFGMKSSAQCSKTQPDSGPGEGMAGATSTNMFAALGCCGSNGKSACWEDVSESVCKSSSSWLPDHMVSGGPSSLALNCGQMALAMGYSTSVDCSTTQKRTMGSQLGAGGCCGTTKKNACWVDLSANVCKNAADYLPFHIFEEHESSGAIVTCNEAAVMSGMIAESKGCEYKNTTLKMAQNGCCGTGASVGYSVTATKYKYEMDKVCNDSRGPTIVVAIPDSKPKLRQHDNATTKDEPTDEDFMNDDLSAGGFRFAFTTITAVAAAAASFACVL